jgi:bifunctional non-homologous end joining protein LigD
MKSAKVKASFVEPMLLLRSESLPEGANWLYELKLDGYRALAIKTGGKVQLRSRNNNDFGDRYPLIVKALAAMLDETVIDGEVVALDGAGRPSFNTLQNYGSSRAPVFYYAFDVLLLAGKNIMREPLASRRQLLERKVLTKLGEPVRRSPALEGSLADLTRSVREQNLEGLVAKRRDSIYEPGQRSGAWRKMRVNQGQEFVIGGYTPSGKSFDALIFGYYEGKKLMYAARTRNGFTPRSRLQLFERLRGLQIDECPFANLPESRSGRWGQGLTAAKMAECRWLKPQLVGQFEFVEWTPDNHLRHSRFIALRENKKAKDVRREPS